MHNIHLMLSVLSGLVLYFSMAPVVGTSRTTLRKGRCSLSYYKSMRMYDCVGLNLSQIPDDLSTNTEILEISMNRIRELTNNSFKQYTYLRKLYLNDNMIMTIEPGTFNGLDDLETLDLGMNALIEVPVTIFHLPSLQSLMLGKNMRLDIMDLLKKASPISAPLQYLDISYSPMLIHLPMFEVMTDLLHLNSSGNNLMNVSIANFVALCNLKYFTNDNLTMTFNTNCDCYQIDRWFEWKDIKSSYRISEKCEPLQDAESCQLDSETIASENSVYDRCNQQFASKQISQKLTKFLYTGAGIALGILVIVGICFFYYRWQQLPDPNRNGKRNNEYEKATVHPLIVTNDEK